MKKLSLIGLGLWNEKDLTKRALEEIEKADVVYLENYTSKLPGTTKQKLEQETGKKIQLANRKFIEGGKILLNAKSNHVALLVPGDPLIATTHTDILLRAKKQDIKTEVIHNTSIYNAVTETGLQIYKFGKTATVTFWKPNYEPKSFYKTLKQNKERGLHTLLLLDLEKTKDKYLSPQEAIRTLLEIEKQEQKEVFTEETEVVIASKLGSPEREIKYGKAKEIGKETEIKPPASLIVPGELHPLEEEYLQQFKVNKGDQDN